MKIISKQEFYKMPKGTLFSYYQPCIIDGLMIKGETIYNEEDPIDFYYGDLIGNISTSPSIKRGDILDAALHHSTEFKLRYNDDERDGLYDDDAFYFVYDSGTICEFSKVINECVGYDCK